MRGVVSGIIFYYYKRSFFLLFPPLLPLRFSLLWVLRGSFCGRGPLDVSLDVSLDLGDFYVELAFCLPGLSL